MNRHFLAVCLWALAALFAIMLAGAIRDTRGHAPARVITAVAAGIAALIAVLVNAAVDLW